MWAIRQIFEHNYNNFRCSVTMSYELYRAGKFSRGKMTVLLFRCCLERMKPRHWLPINFR